MTYLPDGQNSGWESGAVNASVDLTDADFGAENDVPNSPQYPSGISATQTMMQRINVLNINATTP